MKYSNFQQTADYRSAIAGAIAAVSLVRADNPSIKFDAGMSGFTTNPEIEALPVETIGKRIADQIVSGRFSGTASANYFYTPERGDKIIPSSSTFAGLQWHAYRYLTEGPLAGVPVDMVTYWTFARAPIQQGARGLLTGELSGPFIELLNGEEASQRLGTF